MSAICVGGQCASVRGGAARAHRRQATAGQTGSAAGRAPHRIVQNVEDVVHQRGLCLPGAECGGQLGVDGDDVVDTTEHDRHKLLLAGVVRKDLVVFDHLIGKELCTPDARRLRGRVMLGQAMQDVLTHGATRHEAGDAHS